MLCYRCGGTGKYLGNGMMMSDCRICDDDGQIKALKQDSAHVKIDRRSQSYKDSIKEIMQLNPDISRAEAVAMFDEAYDKV
jgi:hypothetical protein